MAAPCNFTKQVALNSDSGEGIVDLYQHFQSPQTVACGGFYSWFVAVQGAYVVQKKGNSKKLKSAGIPFEVKCSHSFYTCKTRCGEVMQHFNQLGLYQLGKLGATEKINGKGEVVPVVSDGSLFTSTNLLWAPFDVDQGDILKVWVSYPQCILERGDEINWEPFENLMSRVQFFLWLGFQKIWTPSTQTSSERR